LAEGLKNSGNQAYKLGRLRWSDAIQFYTNALAHQITDPALLATIYGNRAQVHLKLGNLGKSLEDCRESLLHDPNNVKVVYRTAKALFLLGKYKESMDHCVRALKLDPTNSPVQRLFSDARDKLTIERRRRAEKQARAAEDARQSALIGKACDLRGIRRIRHDSDYSFHGTGDSLLDAQPYLDDSERLHFPVLLLYPEHHTTDTVRDWHEDVTVRDMLGVVLAPAPDWDTDRHYAIGNVVVAFRENESSDRLRRVDLDATLGDVLKRPGFTLYDDLPTFLILSKSSETYWRANVQPYLKDE
jgi:tetratricopeptide (TPR) repeat protein